MAIVVGLALVEAVEAVVYAFGALLLYVAYRALRGRDEAADASASPVLRLVQHALPTTRGLVRRFRYLDRTIALVLAFVGLKILAAEIVPIGDLASLAVIAALLAGGIVTSLVGDHVDPPAPEEAAGRRPPRCPPELTGQSLDGRHAEGEGRSLALRSHEGGA